jgi:hypothetical protein
MDRRFSAAILAQDKAVQIAMVASEKAVVKAEVAAEKRFEANNEYRSQLTEQAATFMPRAEAEQRLSQMLESISELKQAQSGRGGRDAGATATRALFLALGALGLTLLGVVVAIVVAIGG